MASQVQIRIGDGSSMTSEGSGDAPLTIAPSDLLSGTARDTFRAALHRLKTPAIVSIDLGDPRDPDFPWQLAHADLESLLTQWAGDLGNMLRIVRDLPSQRNPLQPAGLPVNCLVLIGPDDEFEEQAFRTATSETLVVRKKEIRQRSDGRKALDSRFHVCYLCGRAERLGDSTVLTVGRVPLDPFEIRTSIEQSGCRLLVVAAAGDLGAARDWCYRVCAGSGTAVVLVSLPGFGFFRALLDRLLRTVDLDSAWFDASSVSAPLLYLRREPQSDVLGIRAAWENLARASRHQIRVAADLQRRSDVLPHRVVTRYEARDDDDGGVVHEIVRHPEIQRAIEAAYSAWRTTAPGAKPSVEGIATLSKLVNEAEPLLAAAGKRLEHQRTQAARVVNTYVRQGGRILKPSEILSTAAETQLDVQIGPPVDWSNVKQPAAIPEQKVWQKSSKDISELRVCLFTTDVAVIGPDEATLFLPRKGPSQPVRFTLKTPAQHSLARVTVAIYFEHNLLQSLLLELAVGDSGVGGSGNWAQVDYALTDDFLGIEELEHRSINILASESGETHTLAIAGTAVKFGFDLAGAPSSDVVRRTLLDICCETDNQNRPVKYLYKPDNSGTPEKFERDVIALATVGYQLYAELLMSPNRGGLPDELRDQLRRPASIQVANARSSRTIYPWSLVYDKALVSGAKNRVCPKAIQTILGGDFRETCASTGCKFEDDTNVVCPFAFWGFKHSIEQPPATSGQAVTEIWVAEKPSCIMVGDSALDARAHWDELRAQSSITGLYEETKDAFARALSNDEPELLYFFCHGGRTHEVPWLGIGANDRILPSDFAGWQLQWRRTHPLVFINGCHTVDLGPNDLLNFVMVFAWARAAGVIGTEIGIPTSLAREFGRELIRRFTRRQRISDAIQQVRLQLLAKLNLLGLAYTPYCYGNLRLQIIRA